eukprot:5845339-Prymnesium_polylepis.1
MFIPHFSPAPTGSPAAKSQRKALLRLGVLKGERARGARRSCTAGEPLSRRRVLDSFGWGLACVLGFGFGFALGFASGFGFGFGSGFGLGRGLGVGLRGGRLRD